MQSAKKKSTSFGMKAQSYMRSSAKNIDEKKYVGYINYEKEA
jgi:hypothetical protein